MEMDSLTEHNTYAQYRTASNFNYLNVFESIISYGHIHTYNNAHSLLNIIASEIFQNRISTLQNICNTTDHNTRLDATCPTPD